jgi:hypothetical protein
MKIKKLLALLTGTLLFFYSCEQVNELSKDSSNNDVTTLSQGDTGKLTIEIPLLSSTLQDSLQENGEEELTDRAYLFAKEVVTILRDSGGGEINRETSSLPGGSIDDPGAEVTVEMDVPWGIGYTVEVHITDGILDQAIVEGESASFDMGLSEVSLSMALLPASPTVLDSTDSIGGTLTSSVYGTSSFATMGEEIWFSQTPENTGLKVLTLDTPGEALLFQADSDGFFQTSAREHNSSQPTVLISTLTAGEPVYTGLIILEDNSEETSYTLTSQNISDGILKLSLSGLDSTENAALIMEIEQDGTTLVSLNGAVSGTSAEFFLLEENGLDLWEGLGSYEYRLILDRDYSGDGNEGDLENVGTLTLSEGENTLSLTLEDLESYTPDITGLWFYLSNDFEKEMEFTILIEEDGTFTIYTRRHDDPGDILTLYEEDDFIPFIEGIWTLEAYQMSLSLESIDLCSIGLLTEELSSENETLFSNYGFIGLQNQEGIEAIFDSVYNFITVPLPLTDELFLGYLFTTYSSPLVQESATSSEGEVTIYGIETESYRIKDTWLATDQSGDGEDFRSFTIDNLPAEAQPYL